MTVRRGDSGPDRRDPARGARDDRRERGPRPGRRDGERSAPERAGRERERTAPDVRGSPPIGAMRAARLARHYINEMTGKDPEEVTALLSTEDGGWRADVQVVETRRIPDSTDILAVYQAELDANGELLSYRRIRRYARCQVQEE